MFKKTVITFIIYLAILGLMILANALLPSSKYVPAAGIFVFWGLLAYNPVALIHCIYKMMRGDNERLISLLIHAQILMFLAHALYTGRFVYYF